MAVIAYGGIWWFMCGQWSTDLKKTSKKHHALLGKGGTGLRDFCCTVPKFTLRFDYMACVSEEAGEAQATMQNAGLVRKKKCKKSNPDDTVKYTMTMDGVKSMTHTLDHKAAEWRGLPSHPLMNVFIDQQVFNAVSFFYLCVSFRIFRVRHVHGAQRTRTGLVMILQVIAFLREIIQSKGMNFEDTVTLYKGSHSVKMHFVEGAETMIISRKSMSENDFEGKPTETYEIWREAIMSRLRRCGGKAAVLNVYPFLHDD